MMKNRTEKRGGGGGDLTERQTWGKDRDKRGKRIREAGKERGRGERVRERRKG